MVTIREIATLSQCSASTVSIVLRGKATERKISLNTQKKVFDTAAKLGYQPNIAARSLRGGSSGGELQIALFWAQDFRASMLIRFWDGLRQALEKETKKIKLVIIPYTNGQLKDARALISKSDCHAAIICNASKEDLDFLKSADLSIPIVLYNRICPGYSSVNVDDARMGALAAQALSNQGCHEACILAGESAFEGMDIRISGFAEEGNKCNLRISKTYSCKNSTQGGYETVKLLLNTDWKNTLPEGIFCASSAIAHGSIRAFGESGIFAKNLPKIVAIGNGTESQDRYSTPSLSVINIPMEKMAKECLHILIDMIFNSASPHSILLDVEYIIRESCGPLLP